MALKSTAADYLRFCRMLGNGGELDGVRILGPRTLRLMTLNRLPGGKDLATMAQSGAETQREGQGFGLGFAVLLDHTVAQIIGTQGEFYWGGAASTAFFVNPNGGPDHDLSDAAQAVVDLPHSPRASGHDLLRTCRVVLGTLAAV
jgi:CubicO group peptidase (beta-lactamase class C family)